VDARPANENSRKKEEKKGDRSTNLSICLQAESLSKEKRDPRSQKAMHTGKREERGGGKKKKKTVPFVEEQGKERTESIALYFSDA